MKNQDYFGALKVFLKDVNKLDNVAFAAIPTLGSLIASAVMSALTVLGLVGKHSKTQPSKHATPAVKAIDYRTNRHNKRFGGRFVNRRVIPRHDNISHGGGGGGGGIHTGGGFSGGGGSFSGGGTHF